MTRTWSRLPFIRGETLNEAFVALLIALPLANYWNLKLSPEAGDHVPFEDLQRDRSQAWVKSRVVV